MRAVSYLLTLSNFVILYKMKRYYLTSKVVLYPGMAGWHFISVEKKTATLIKEKYGKKRRGFGSIKVIVTIGNTTWNTSIFPDKSSGRYLLPLKAEVRKKESILNDDTVKFSIQIV